MSDNATATTTITIPTQAMEQARAKLEEALSDCKAADWVAVRSDSISFKGFEEMKSYRRPLVHSIEAIEAVLALMAQDNQAND